MPSVNDIAGYFHWLQGNISGLLPWLRTYRVGYLVGLLIAARIAWRAYKFLSLRRAKGERARIPTEPGQAASSPGRAGGSTDGISRRPDKP